MVNQHSGKKKSGLLRLGYMKQHFLPRNYILMKTISKKEYILYKHFIEWMLYYTQWYLLAKKPIFTSTICGVFGGIYQIGNQVYKDAEKRCSKRRATQRD